MRSLLSVNHEVQSFLKAHPRENGWIIYHCCKPLVRDLYLQYLVDWLEDTCPQVVTTYAVGKESSVEELLGVEAHVVIANHDIDRHPNPHLSLGVGEHYCMGANLARMELRVAIDELITRETKDNSARDAAGRPRLLGFKFLRLTDDPLAGLRQLDGDNAPRVSLPGGRPAGL